MVMRDIDPGWLAETFGTKTPRILEFPHCIVSAGAVVSEILDQLATPAGIFGSEWPRVDAQGEPFVPDPDDERIVDAFGLWALPRNQERIEEWCEGIDAAPIRWLIDARADPGLLREMHDPWVDWENFAFYIDRLADWIDRLGWALVPLEPEGRWVLFVTSSSGADRVRWVERRLAPGP